MGALSILAATLVPNLIARSDRGARDTEVMHLKAVARGSETYLRSNRAWPPALAAHSPDYAPFPFTTITVNDRGFPRYYFVHPATAGFNNAAGLAEPSLTDVRFMAITNLEQDAAPVIVTPADFEVWWTTDESATPGLHISRGNVAELFRRLTLMAADPGGSYQIDGVTTNSGGGTLTARTTYHLKGTPIGLDGDVVYGTPEITFVLAANAEYRYCGLAGWQMGANRPCPSVLWVTTTGNADVPPPGVDWSNAELVAFDEPNLTYESGPTGTTSGIFRSVFDLANFTATADIDAIHYVTKDMTIGTGATVDVFVGDLLLSTAVNETLTSTNTLSVNDEDVFIFRPDVPGDYTAGTFWMLIDASTAPSLWANDTWGVSLVEQDTVVGDVTLPAGTFLLTRQNQNDIYHFAPVDVGSPTSGINVLLIAGSAIGLPVTGHFYGVDLVEADIRMGDVVLQSGQILATLRVNAGTTGDPPSIATESQDIFILNVTITGAAADATATLLFDGSDVGLAAPTENIDGLTVVP